MPTHPQTVHKQYLFMLYQFNTYNLFYLVRCIVYFLRNSLSISFNPFHRWLLFFVFAICTSCTLNTTKTLTPVKSEEQTFKNNYFSNLEKDYVYKAKIAAFGNNFGGILVIKKLSPAHHRIAFTTEFGAKIFDFEFIQSEFKVNYIVAALNKKIIINNLRKNFQILVKETLPLNKKYKGLEQSVYQAHYNKQYYFYFYSNQNGLLEKMVQTSKFKEKLIILFQAEETQFAHSIQILHQKLPLKIDLIGF